MILKSTGLIFSKMSLIWVCWWCFFIRFRSCISGRNFTKRNCVSQCIVLGGTWDWLAPLLVILTDHLLRYYLPGFSAVESLFLISKINNCGEVLWDNLDILFQSQFYLLFCIGWWVLCQIIIMMIFQFNHSFYVYGLQFYHLEEIVPSLIYLLITHISVYSWILILFYG